MNPINLQIVFADGSTTTVNAVAADLIAFESHFDISVARLQTEVRLTHLFFLAWHASKRTKQTELNFEDWAETIEMVTEAPVKK